MSDLRYGPGTAPISRTRFPLPAPAEDTVESLAVEMAAHYSMSPTNLAEAIRADIESDEEPKVWSQHLWSPFGDRITALITRERARHVQEPACPTAPPQPSPSDECRGDADGSGTTPTPLTTSAKADGASGGGSGVVDVASSGREPSECEFCSTSSGIVDEYARAIERLRPGHTAHCNSGFVHGCGECSCGRGDGEDPPLPDYSVSAATAAPSGASDDRELLTIALDTWNASENAEHDLGESLADVARAVLAHARSTHRVHEIGGVPSDIIGQHLLPAIADTLPEAFDRIAAWKRMEVECERLRAERDNMAMERDAAMAASALSIVRADELVTRAEAAVFRAESCASEVTEKADELVAVASKAERARIVAMVRERAEAHRGAGVWSDDAHEGACEALTDLACDIEAGSVEAGGAEKP